MVALSRRAILGAVAIAAATPHATLAAQSAPDPWEALMAGLAVMHADLPALAAEARQQGYSPADLLLVMIPQNGEAPWLDFRRRFH